MSPPNAPEDGSPGSSPGEPIPARNLPVIVNRSGGTASRAGEALQDELVSAFAAAGSSVSPQLVEGRQVQATVRAHATALRIVVGGGDGTIGSAAGLAAEHGFELAILPLGTRNHFARQLGVPLDLEEAAKLAAGGTAVPIDVGDCGGEAFINNVSVGAYVDLVRERQHTGLPKALASIVAALHILFHLRARRFSLVLDGERIEIVTAMLFVGNNRYEISEGHPGVRDSLTDGRMSVFALAPLSAWQVMGLAFRTLVGRPDMRRDFALDCTVRDMTIEGPGSALEIALDGERKTIPLPLNLRIRPRALRVVAGPQGGG
ncbi:diacylglycerol/lipid kinase family protein [Tsuneonella sp. HG222]